MHIFLRIALIALIGATLPLQAEKATGAILVNWVNPETYKDAHDSDNKSEKSLKLVLSDLEDHLKTRTAKRIPAGYTLTINVSALDLEGEFEPWRGAQYNDVRIVKDVYPARVELSYTLQDSAEYTLLSGEEKLSSLGDFPPFNADTTRFAYTKELFDDFARKIARQIKKAEKTE